ncbi:hypothetical protein, partial [Hafnia paralvei]|uniref:hypothetical protein n=1 Tax=Hafnia paralvei TaxID=546367 RepID=UPI001D0FACA2
SSQRSQIRKACLRKLKQAFCFLSVLIIHSGLGSRPIFVPSICGSNNGHTVGAIGKAFAKRRALDFHYALSKLTPPDMPRIAHSPILSANAPTV